MKRPRFSGPSLPCAAIAIAGFVNPAAAQPRDTRDAPVLLTAPTREQMPAVLDQAQAEFDEAQAMLINNPERARQHFRSAAARFESVVDAGIENGYLEYNLGNCYLQAGDLGRAILHYRRAQRLLPRNPYLLDNLHTARERCITSIAPSRAGAILRNALFWHYQTSAGQRARFAFAAYVCFWLVLVWRTARPQRWLTALAVVLISLCAASSASAALTHWRERNSPEGVLIAMDVPVYKGPGPGYQRQFEQPLQPGTEFTLRQRRQGWWEIELPDGQRGWVEAAQAELIPPAPKDAPPRPA